METCETKKRNDDHNQTCPIVEGILFLVLGCFPASVVAGLISSNRPSHDKHFIVTSHYGHVTMKWEGREPPPLSLKGGRTNGRKARLLTRKMRADPAF